LPSGEQTAFWLVHFVAPVDKAWLVDLVLAGAVQVQVVDACSAVFSMTATTADGVRALPVVDFVGAYHPAYAVDLDLAGVDQAFTAASLATLTLNLPPATGEGNLQVQLFDALDEASVRPLLEAAGATIVAETGTIVAETAGGFLLSVAPERCPAILAVPGVFHAALPARIDLCSHHAGVIVGANQVRQLGTVNFLVNLDGASEIGAVVDSGFDVGSLAGAVVPLTGAMTPFHPDLATSMRLLRNSNTPQNTALGVPDGAPHGTHVAGIVAGDGASSPATAALRAVPTAGWRRAAP